MRCQAICLVHTRFRGGKAAGSGERCPTTATEVVAGRHLCWTHARREERIAAIGYAPAERQAGLDVRRFADA